MLPWIQLIFTGVVSALVTAWATAWATAWRTKISETTARRVAYLESQIQKVYCPAYLQLSESSGLIGVHQQYWQAWDKVNDLKTVALRNNDEQTASELEGELNRLHIAMKELSFKMTDRLNDAVVTFHDNAALLDPSDVPLVVRLYVDMTRTSLEISIEAAEFKISERVLTLIDGDGEERIRLQAELIREFNVRYYTKNAELMELRGLMTARSQKSGPWWRRLLPRRADRQQAA